MAELARRLRLGDAVTIGLGSMIGAGVFSAFQPAARAAGSALLIGLAIAAFVALCNATSSAQLAIAYPTSGGTYLYGRERLGPWWGFLAGWGFVIGKTASCAAMALTFGAYAAPDGWERVFAVAAVVVLTAVNTRGITKTAAASRILVVITLLVLTLLVVASLHGGDADVGRLSDWSESPHGSYGVLQSAGLLFFAFAGYARIATLGEEVIDPRRTIPRAIVRALAIVVVVYAVVACTLLVTIGPEATAADTAPLAAAVKAGSWDWAAPFVRVGGAVAALGALLGLIAGVGRTSLAMARNADLPTWLDAIHPRHHVPHRAELALGVVVCALVLVTDLRGAIGFSSFGVLLYYFVANLSAYTQTGGDRRYPRVLQVLGAVACLVLVVTLPARAIIVGLIVLAAGGAYRVSVLRRVGGDAR